MVSICMETVVCFVITTCFIQLNGRNGRRGRGGRRGRRGRRCRGVVVVGVEGVPAAEGCGLAPDSGYAWRQLKFGTCVMSVH